MTARTFARPDPLSLSKRAAGRLLGIDYAGEAMQFLIDHGYLRLVPWGRGFRIPLEDCQKVARQGFSFDGVKPRTRPSRSRVAPAPGRIRDIVRVTP